jgi:hypothetical protein
MKQKILPLLLCLIFVASSFAKETQKSISVEEYKQAVYASWIGQIIGNTYGLGYEFVFIDEPGPKEFPYGYPWTLELLKEHDGAFSDDDTDIEYMYLIQMEDHGIEPPYSVLSDAWKRHVSRKVWAANRVALNLMRAGHYPPVTGDRRFNPQWMQIDPQLVNEIWAVTAPGMVGYAVDKSLYAAKITNDDYGVEPTLYYAALYSAAFVEKDINRLIDIASESMPEGARFTDVVAHMRELHAAHPNDWQEARRITVEKYYHQAEFFPGRWDVLDAQLNGALGVLALLYGAGDFQNTLDYACGMGMDADNQAATICGLLGIIGGIESIPHELMFPLEDADWEKPFNDSYRMITREGLPSAKLAAMADRIAAQGIKVALAHGGELIEEGGVETLVLPVSAAFVPPFELNPIPTIQTAMGEEFIYPLFAGGAPGKVKWSANPGLPEGLSIEKNQIQGSPVRAGEFSFELAAELEGKHAVVDVECIVFPQNLAASAVEILHNLPVEQGKLEILRDGDPVETYLSLSKPHERRLDHYGYRWDEPLEIEAIQFNCGTPNEFYGWFTSFDVQYLSRDKWVSVDRMHISPELNLENSQWLKPAQMEYTIRFDTVKTTAIRIIGNNGGIEKDPANAHLGLELATAISELKAFGPVK